MANILYVDDNDNVIGAGSMHNAVSKGIGHRIARVLVFNAKGKLLIQKRSLNINFPGKWDQSAAGHVDEGEDYDVAAIRELKEEVGISGIPLKLIAKYRSNEMKKNKIMKRFNAIYVGTYEGEVNFSEKEVSEVKWVTLTELEKWMQLKPVDFTEGFINSYAQYKSKK